VILRIHELNETSFDEYQNVDAFIKTKVRSMTYVKRVVNFFRRLSNDSRRYLNFGASSSSPLHCLNTNTLWFLWLHAKCERIWGIIRRHRLNILVRAGTTGIIMMKILYV